MSSLSSQAMDISDEAWTHVSTAGEAPSHAQCEINASIERPSLSSGETHAALAMVSIAVPEADQASDEKRAALDIVACVDRSGSMAGAKMSLMQDTLTLLVTKACLTRKDRVGIISFDHEVTEEFALAAMNEDGKTKARAAVRGLTSRGATNLSGGLLKAIDTLASSAGDATRTKVVLLFTDGIANNGIQKTPELQQATQGALGGQAISLFTFGYGADHNEDMLRSVAATGSGLYYYIANQDGIPSAFADALGGIMSVAAQNAELTLHGTPDGATVGKVLGSGYKLRVDDVTGSTTVSLGDLYAQEAKDILFELNLPALPAPRDEPARVLRAQLRYFSVAASAMQEVAVELCVARPATTPDGQPVDTKLDEQRNRMRVAEAMAQASALADGGALEAGRDLLARACKDVMRSPSAATPLSKSLVNDMEALDCGYEDAAVYRSAGSKMSKMQAMSHMQQRSTHTSGASYTAGSTRKAAMKRAWAGTE